MLTCDCKCEECGKTFEVFRRFSELDEQVNTCLRRTGLKCQYAQVGRIIL